MRSKDVEQLFVWIIRLGLWVIPFLPLFLSGSMLFPFITGKNFAFRIVIDILFAVWVGLVLLRPEYRPRLTPLFKAATIFILVVFFADLFGMNPYRSFFSNYERMEGFMMLGHLYLYFVMLASVFRTRRDWMIFFHLTLAASVIVSYIALLQRMGYNVALPQGQRVHGTIGNAIYLAAYLASHVWLLLLLIFYNWKKKWLRFAYGAIIAFELLIIAFTETRGTSLGLLAAAIFLVLSIVLFWKKAFPSDALKWRKYAVVFLGFLIVTPFTLWFFRDTPFLQQYSLVQRFTEYSLTGGTVQSRFMVWGMAWKGVMERPILGWGQENYYLVFQKYYDPGMWGQEPWFDRSHNIIFDWLVHTGVVGLTAYLSMLVVALWGLLRSAFRGMIHFWEGFVLIALFITAFVQNFFVFDNLNTYLLFFAFLSYTEFVIRPAQTGTTAGDSTKMAKPKQKDPEIDPAVEPSQAVLISGIFMAVVFVSGFYLHIKPIQQSQALITALQAPRTQGITADQIMGFFQKALSYNSFGTTEVREQLANAARGIIGATGIDNEQKKKFIDFALSELRKETAHGAKDVKHLLFLGSILSSASSIDPVYGDEAERVLQEAIKISPTKQIVYLEFAQLYLRANRPDRAIDLLRTAWEFDRAYAAAGANLWFVGIIVGRDDIVNEVREVLSIEEMGGPDVRRLGAAYFQYGKVAESEPFFADLVKREPKDARVRATYALILATLGKRDAAVEEMEEAILLEAGIEAELREAVDNALKQAKI